LKNLVTILDLLAITVWLGGGNLILINSIKRQGLPWQAYFSPWSVLKRQDWVRLLLLLIAAIFIEIVRMNISNEAPF
jgi:hypothetical protein